MFSLDMCLQVVALSGSVVAESTGIRLFPGVNPLVPSEVSAITSLVAAVIT